MQPTTTAPPGPHIPVGHAGADGSLFVLFLGLVTSGLALGGVFLLNEQLPDLQIMGRYVCFVVPYGAILVGSVASSGYGLGSWLRGVKISGALMAGIVGLQVAAYFVAQYLEFASLGLTWEDGTPVGFLSYFHWATTSFAWARDDGSAGAALGAWGYGIRALEILGFAAGGLVAPALLRSKPYCDRCSRYMAHRSKRWLPASLPVEKIKKRDTARSEAYEREQQAAYDEGIACVESLMERGAEGDAAGFAALLTERAIGTRQAVKLPARIVILISACPGCSAGRLRARLATGFGERVKFEDIGQTELPLRFVNEVSR